MTGIDYHGLQLERVRRLLRPGLQTDEEKGDGNRCGKKIAKDSQNSYIFVSCKFRKKLYFRHNIHTILLILLIVLLTGFAVFGQNPLRTVNRDNGLPEIPDTLTLPVPDSLFFARDSISVTDSLLRLDSIVRTDSLFRLDSLDLLRKSSLEQPAFSGAKDSVRQDFSNGQRKMYYWETSR